MPEQKILQNMSALGIRDTAYAVNTNIGGQLGLGMRAPYLDAASPLVLPPVVPIVLHVPGMYANDEKMMFVLKNLWECYSKSITGIDLEYTADTDDTPVGHDGQNMSVPKKIKRTGINPSVTFQELMGNIVWNVHRKWMTDFSDPDTNFSYIGMEGNLNIIPSDYSMSVLFIQYDLTGRPDNIIDAFIVSNIFPQTTGPLGSEKNIGDSRIIDRNITYTGIIHHNETIRQMAFDVSTAMNYHKIKYFKNAPSIQYGVEKHIDQDIRDSGIDKEIKSYLEMVAG